MVIKMKKNSFYIIIIYLLLDTLSFSQSSLTEILATQFHQAWNKGNINEMVSLLQPDAFFKSPDQLRNGRERMGETVLKTNPSAYKFVNIKEQHSKVADDIAWSIGEFTCDIYDEYGYKTSKQFNGTYTYVFTRKDSNDWKVQMLIYYEKLPSNKN